jgi:two-component system sensor histidine kinase DesK
MVFNPSPSTLAALYGGNAKEIIRKERKTELQHANDEIARLIKDEKRQRIAKNLHDMLGHTLSLAVLKSELVERLIFRKPVGSCRSP